MTLVVTHAKVSGIADDAAAAGAGEVVPSDWNANHALAGLVSAAQLNASVVQAVTNDTNIQGTISAQNLTFSWGGTLAAGRLNANVVQGITNDTNVTGSISAQNLTLGWTGTLAAGRLNANVVQGVTNDTNVTGSITAQNLTFNWSGTLAVGRGGTGGGTASGTLLDNITGFASTGFLTRTGAGAYAFQSATNGITNANLAQSAAWTLKGNATASTANEADFTIDSLTLKAVPTTSDELVIWDAAASAMKKTTIGDLPTSSGTVTDVASNAGTITGSGSDITTTGTIQLDGNYTGWAIANCTLAASVSANILTVAVKDNAGNNPSSTSPCYFNFRSATATTGSTTLVKQTAALSMTTNATGATLGTANTVPFRLWVVVFNNAGTNVLALWQSVTGGSSPTALAPLNECAVASATGISNTATSAGTFYCPNGTTIASKAFRILGYLEWSSGLTTAGTYASGPTTIQTFGPGIKKPGDVVQSAFSSSSSNSALSLSISPSSAANLIKMAGMAGTGSTTTLMTITFKRSSTTLLTMSQGGGSVSGNFVSAATVLDAPGTTSSTAYSTNSSAGSYNDQSIQLDEIMV
jgi:hypothetical protein